MDNFPNRSIFTESLFSLLSIANPLVSNKMKDTELRQERDRDLYRTYVRGLREKNFSSLQEAAEWAISQPAERFYVSSKVLVNYIASRRAGAVSSPIPERTDYFVKKWVIGIYRTAFSHGHMMWGIKTGSSNITNSSSNCFLSPIS